MSELIAIEHSDPSHLLKAEADIDHLSDTQLIAAGAASNSLDDVRRRLRQGLWLYCDPHPQRPYVVYFRGQHYLNPAAQGSVDAKAIERLQRRFYFIHLERHEPPVAVRHGGLKRQYYNQPDAEPQAYPAPLPATIWISGPLLTRR